MTPQAGPYPLPQTAYVATVTNAAHGWSLMPSLGAVWFWYDFHPDRFWFDFGD